MKNLDALLLRRVQLPTVLGLADGILTALTLAAGQLTEPNHPMLMNRALRIAAGALVSGAFVFYVAHYAQLRGELAHAERQLNLISHGRLASTRLGRSVLIEAFWSAVIASSASFLGALVPLLTGVFLPAFRWGAVVTSVGCLGTLGIALAKAVHGSYWRWCAGLAAGGGIFSVIGIGPHII
jgi:VIT1/CCC1 family predicted Fe2+/Mn2+ transporter